MSGERAQPHWPGIVGDGDTLTCSVYFPRPMWRALQAMTVQSEANASSLVVAVVGRWLTTADESGTAQALGDAAEVARLKRGRGLTDMSAD